MAWQRMVLVLGWVGSAACRSGGPASAASAGVGMRPISPEQAAEFERAYRARKDSATRRFTAADLAFMQEMIHHHAQALEMSALAEPNGASPSVRTLAARIINAQRDEIATMQGWLRLRGQGVPELHERDGTIMVHAAGGHDAHAGHGTMMPGMLSAAQLAELRAARGAAFDRLFLRFMIQHHRGAVTMVERLFATDGAGQDEAVFKFASDAQVDQGTEIARMELLLAALGGGPQGKPVP